MWKYKGKIVKVPPEGKYGFCYKITCNHPDYEGFIYVGKKTFTFRKKKRIAKKARTSRKRMEVIHTDSDWQNYWGSSKWMNEVRALIGDKYFEREILSFASNKTDLSLQEWEWIINLNVLRIEKAFNLWASGRIYKKHL